MKKSYIIKSAFVVLAAAVLFTACQNQGTASGTQDESGASSVSSEVSDAGSQSGTTDNSGTSDSSSESDSVAESDSSSDTSSEIQLVTDGKFTLQNGKLSFTLPDGWELISSTIAYQFAGADTENKFNLVVSKSDKSIEDVTSEEMTATYETTMEDFKLVTFEHTTVKDKPAVYIQLSGKLSQVNSDTVVTQYMIQSGDDAYCFSFTQSVYDETFASVIDSVIDSLEIQ